ncbi:MAG TPA: PilZ domain-containing protein [Steroidobacteraceae bacterium]|nr:PilZ domain-containing protein [Steroidobacteraceae bacterium]
MQTGRTEHRGGSNISATVSQPDKPEARDLVVIENISSHGARILCHRPLRVHDHLALAAALGDIRVSSEVVYCQELGERQYAVGLKFIDD